MELGVNIDHIAVLREARKINDPSPLDAIGICRLSGANQITIHLREDRRHINDNDAKFIIKNSLLPVNLECSINDEIINIICKLKPNRATLVPENRNEVSTEGGLDLKKNFEKIKYVVKLLHQNDIEVSLFIDPNQEMVELSKQLNSDWVELHTGTFSNIFISLYSNLSLTSNFIKELDLPRKELKTKLEKSLNDILQSSKRANEFGLKVAAGHGLNYNNVSMIAKIKYIHELNIGQSIIARSIFVGLGEAIKNMKELIINEK